MAYPDKPSGWDVHQKTTDQLYPIQCKFFPFAAVFIILYFECHIFFIHAKDTAVADRYPVGITTKVIHYCFGTGKRLPDVSDPVLSITDVQEFLVFVPVTVFCGSSFTAELPLFVQRFQPVQELSSEKFGNCLSRKKESPFLLTPVAVCIKPSTGT